MVKEMKTDTTKDLVVPEGWLLTFVETAHQHRWQPVTMSKNIINPEAIQHAIDSINNDEGLNVERI